MPAYPRNAAQLFMPSMLAVLAAVFASPAQATLIPLRDVSITWVAPGDDGMVGKVARYDMRYSFNPITEHNFFMLLPAWPYPVPERGGTEQTIVLRELDARYGWYFAIKAVDEAGNWSPISNVAYLPPSKESGFLSEDLGGAAAVPLTLSFSSPAPNPARESARLDYALPQASSVRVEVYDAMGRHVRTLTNGRLEAGYGKLSWDLRDDSGQLMSAGVYLVHAQLGAEKFTRRLVVVH